MVGSAYSGKVISYELHKQADHNGAITTVPTLPLYKGLYILRVNLLTKSSHNNEIPIGNRMSPCTSNQIPNEMYVIIYICNKYKRLIV